MYGDNGRSCVQYNDRTFVECHDNDRSFVEYHDKGKSFVECHDNNKSFVECHVIMTDNLLSIMIMANHS